MKIDELIARLEEHAKAVSGCGYPHSAELYAKAAETICLLWEVAQDSTNSKYKMQIDEWRGDDDSRQDG